jgi:hypothetical protein
MMTTMQPIERVAALLKPSLVMLDWINENSDDEEAISLEEVHADATIILLPLFDDEEQIEDYLSQIYQEIFEEELASWDEDETTWPEERSLEVFLEWFDIELHTVVRDAGLGVSANRNRKIMLQ